MFVTCAEQSSMVVWSLYTLVVLATLSKISEHQLDRKKETCFLLRAAMQAICLIVGNFFSFFLLMEFQARNETIFAPKTLSKLRQIITLRI